MIIDGEAQGSMGEIEISNNVDYIVTEIQSNPLNLRRIPRSRAGQGNDLQDCDVFENNNIYIPKSG